MKPERLDWVIIYFLTFLHFAFVNLTLTWRKPEAPCTTKNALAPLLPLSVAVVQSSECGRSPTPLNALIPKRVSLAPCDLSC